MQPDWTVPARPEPEPRGAMRESGRVITLGLTYTQNHCHNMNM